MLPIIRNMILLLRWKRHLQKITELHDQFLEAAETDRKLPSVIRRTKMAFWVDYVNEWSGYGWDGKSEMRLSASPDEIDRYDKIADYLSLMEEKDRKLVWAVAHSAAYRDRGVQWSKIAGILRLNDPRIVKRRYQDALVKLYYKLNKK